METSPIWRIQCQVSLSGNSHPPRGKWGWAMPGQRKTWHGELRYVLPSMLTKHAIPKCMLTKHAIPKCYTRHGNKGQVAAQTCSEECSRWRKLATYSICFSGPYAQYLAASLNDRRKKTFNFHLCDETHTGQMMAQMTIKGNAPHDPLNRRTIMTFESGMPSHPQTTKQHALPRAGLGPVPHGTIFIAFQPRPDCLGSWDAWRGHAWHKEAGMLNNP